MESTSTSSFLNIFSLDHIAEIQEYLSFESLYFVVLSYFLFYLGKKTNDFLQSSFSLDKELLEKDNKALAMSFSGYFLGIGIVVYSVLTSPPSNYGFLSETNNSLMIDALDMLFWGVVGILLLNLSRVFNDKVLMPKFRNVDEIIRDRNVGAGVAQLGSYVGSALVIAGVIGHGGTDSMVYDLFTTLAYFVLSQILLFVFAIVYSSVVSYSLHDEMEQDNEAAGIAYGLNLIAISVFLYYTLIQTENLWLLLISFVNGVVFLLGSRWIFNRIILHKSDINHEIKDDRNWGVAFLEGIVAILIAFVVNGSFL